jgi:bacteriocin leader peptide (microcyclamide/patellamide family)
MNNQNLMPNQAQPIDRITTGQLPSALSELSEEMLQGTDFGADVTASACYPCMPSFDSEVTASIGPCVFMCSFDGDDAE